VRPVHPAVHLEQAFPSAWTGHWQVVLGFAQMLPRVHAGHLLDKSHAELEPVTHCFTAASKLALTTGSLTSSEVAPTEYCIGIGSSCTLASQPVRWV
jgi:hypothetical protein